MNNLSYVSAPAGSGKTYELAKWTTEQVQAHAKIIIAQPTTKLMIETAKAIQSIDATVKPVLFKSRGPRDNVTTRILAHMEGAQPHHGEVIFVTHEALERMADGYKRFWHLVVDETPSVFSSNTLSIPKTRALVTTSTRIVEELIPGIGVIGKASPLLDQIAESEDDGYKPFKPFANAVLDPNTLVLADIGQFNELLNDEKTDGKFSTYHVLRSNFVKPFASATFMSANFLDSELYNFWNLFETISWSKHPIQLRIEAGTRFTGGVHSNGSRLTIRYLFDTDVGLEYLRRVPEGELENPFDRICELVESELGDADYLWHVNKDFQTEVPFDHAGRLPMVAHGINQANFVITHRVTVLSAFNYGTPACRFLKKLGFKEEQFRVMLNYQKDYQTMMRCSLRDPLATRPVQLVVLSKGSAQYIQSKFPGSSVEAIAHDIDPPKAGGRPKSEKQPKTGAQRKAECIARKKAAAMAQ